MKRKLIAAVLIMCSMALALYAKDIGMTSTALTTVNCGGGCVVDGNAKQVTFIFASGSNITIAGGVFSNPPDSSLTLRAIGVDLIMPINAQVNAGSVRVIRVQ